MSNEREKVTVRVAHALCMLKARDLYESDLTYHRRQVAALYDAGLLSTQDHVDALKACEALDLTRKNFCVGWSDAATDCAEVGARSLSAKADAKAAAQESPLARVKRLWAGVRDVNKLPGDLTEALDALVRDGE